MVSSSVNRVKSFDDVPEFLRFGASAAPHLFVYCRECAFAVASPVAELVHCCRPWLAPIRVRDGSVGRKCDDFEVRS